MMKKQIKLDKRPIKQNKDFLKRIYSSNLEGFRVFEMLDGTQMRRRVDEGMTLEKYLSLNWAKRHVRLQIGSPQYDRIVYCAAINSKWEGITRFAWIDGPLTESNYQEISLIFRDIYGEELK